MPPPLLPPLSPTPRRTGARTSMSPPQTSPPSPRRSKSSTRPFPIPGSRITPCASAYLACSPRAKRPSTSAPRPVSMPSGSKSPASVFPPPHRAPRYNLDPSETWLPNLVHHVYTTPVQDLCFRRLSLLFIMMSIGLLVDLNQKNESPRADLYHRLARASLCEMNLMDEPNLDLIQTLVRHPPPPHATLFTAVPVLHDLVSPHFLRQEPGRGLCLEHHGSRRQTGPERECPSPTRVRPCSPESLVGSSCVTQHPPCHRRSPPPSPRSRWKPMEGYSRGITTPQDALLGAPQFGRPSRMHHTLFCALF